LTSGPNGVVHVRAPPRFKEVSEELDSVNFGKVDMEENQQLGTSNGVRALPTLMIMKDGEEEELTRKAGSMSKKSLKTGFRKTPKGILSSRFHRNWCYFP